MKLEAAHKKLLIPKNRIKTRVRIGVHLRNGVGSHLNSDPCAVHQTKFPYSYYQLLFVDIKPSSYPIFILFCFNWSVIPMGFFGTTCTYKSKWRTLLRSSMPRYSWFILVRHCTVYSTLFRSLDQARFGWGHPIRTLVLILFFGIKSFLCAASNFT